MAIVTGTLPQRPRRKAGKPAVSGRTRAVARRSTCSSHRTLLLLRDGAAPALAAAPLLAGFAGTDVFLPMVGRQAGVGTSNWYTTVWIHNPGNAAATATVWLLERGTSNPAPPSIDILVAPGGTEKLENVVGDYFHREVFGAMRVTCSSQRLVVTSRVYSQAVGTAAKDSMGQDFAGVPASFAIGLGERAQILGVHQTIPAADSEFRYNFGFVETTGNTATVRIRVLDANGAEQGWKDLQVLRFSQRQVAFKDHFPALSTENFRLEAEVVSGAGKVIAYGSAIANASQDPTTFEMEYPARVLAENAVAQITGVTAGSGLTGGGTSGEVTLNVGAGDGITVTADAISLANGGVTPAKIQPSATVGQVLMTVAGSPAPGDGMMALAGTAVAWQNPPTAGDVACTECVSPSEIDGSGASSGQILRFAGSTVTWTSETPFSLPAFLSASSGNDSDIFRVINTGAGRALSLWSSSDTALWANSTSGVGIDARSNSNLALIATSTRGDGIKASASLSDKSALIATNASGIGVRAESANGRAVDAFTNDGVGVYASAGNGFAMQALGHVTQDRAGGGWVKAMAWVQGSGIISSCFNSTLKGTAATAVPCGFLTGMFEAGDYWMDFGFRVDDRFISITPAVMNYNPESQSFWRVTANVFMFPSPTQLRYEIYNEDGRGCNSCAAYIFVY